MYIHIGQDMVIRESSIIGIFDLDNTTSSKITREFLNGAQERGSAVTVSEDLPKAFILASESGRYTVYLTQLGAAALSRRALEENFI